MCSIPVVRESGERHIRSLRAGESLFLQRIAVDVQNRRMSIVGIGDQKVPCFRDADVPERGILKSSNCLLYTSDAADE